MGEIIGVSLILFIGKRCGADRIDNRNGVESTGLWVPSIVAALHAVDVLRLRLDVDIAEGNEICILRDEFEVVVFLHGLRVWNLMVRRIVHGADRQGHHGRFGTVGPVGSAVVEGFNPIKIGLRLKGERAVRVEGEFLRVSRGGTLQDRRQILVVRVVIVGECPVGGRDL